MVDCEGEGVDGWLWGEGGCWLTMGVGGGWLWGGWCNEKVG